MQANPIRLAEIEGKLAHGAYRRADPFEAIPNQPSNLTTASQAHLKRLFLGSLDLKVLRGNNGTNLPLEA